MDLSLFADLWSFNCPCYRFTLVAFSSTMERPNTYTGRVVRGLSRQSQNGKNATGSLSGAGFHPIEPLQISQNRKSMDIFTSPLKRDQNNHLWNHFVCDSVGMCYKCLAWMANASPKNEHGDFQGFSPFKVSKPCCTIEATQALNHLVRTWVWRCLMAWLILQLTGHMITWMEKERHPFMLFVRWRKIQ